MAAPTAVPFPRVPRARVPRRALAAALALATVAVGVGLTRGGDEAAAPALAGSVAARFSLEDVRSTGPAVELPAGKPVVVNFFASWCVPCREELPALEQASQQAAGSVAFVGVDVNDSRSKAVELLDATGVTFPAGYDPDGAVATDYRLRGMPTTVFVDARGRVADVAHGRLSAADLDRRLALLTGRSGVGTS
jgi:cytochrome c biogenesis protein CcmG/thiol:disulfide interchange protein DsbE